MTGVEQNRGSASPPFRERRREPRFPADIQAEMVGTTVQCFKDAVYGRTVEISKCGLRLIIRKDLPLKCRIVLILHNTREDSVCMGEVIWRGRHGEEFVYGVQIMNWTYLDPELKYLISQKRVAPLPA